MKSSARVSDANADEERCDEEHIVNILDAASATAND
jgi:hypothetical protein